MSDEVTNRFFEWADRKGLTREEIAEILNVEKRSVSTYRSSGIPKKKYPLIEDRMKTDGSVTGQGMPDEVQQGIQLTIRPTEEEFDAWTAAFKQSAYPTLKEWAIHGLNELAEEKAAPKPGQIPVGGFHLNSSPVQPPENVIAFPDIPLLHAAAGSPVTADADTYTPVRDYGSGRFAVQLHGDSMEPKYRNKSIVILREKNTLDSPFPKKGQIYLFVQNGERTLKIYDTRLATKEEIENELSYVSKADGKTKVKILRSINPDHPEILAKEPIEWLGWLDPADNR